MSTKLIQSSRDEIILQPESSGKYTYAFTHVSDRNYKEIPLKGPGLSITQVVHPLASAAFLSSGGRKPVLSSCSGSDVEVVVDVAVRRPLYIYGLEMEADDEDLGHRAMDY